MKMYSGYEKNKYFIGKANVILILVAFPLVILDKLNNVTATRYWFFILTAFVCFLLMLINELIFHVRKHAFFEVKRIPESDCIALVLGSISVISYILSPYKRYAFAGNGARHVGLIYMLALACMYITISKCYKLQRIDIVMAISVAIFVNGLAVINFIGIDPFGFFSNLSPVLVQNFLSTIGNVDIYGIYAVMTTSISFYLFIMSGKKNLHMFYLISSIIGCMGTIASGSDAAFFGIATFFVIVLLISAGNSSHMSRYMVSLVALIISGKILFLLSAMSRADATRIQGILSTLIYGDGSYIAILLLACGNFILIRWKCCKTMKLNRQNIKRIPYTWIAVISISLAVTAVGFAIFGTHDLLQLWKSYLQFDDTWGNGRGYIWKNLIEGYTNMPFVHKLFGMGEATIGCVLSDYASVHWNLLDGALIDNAHNVPLHFLITMGIAGIATYLWMVGYLVKRVATIWRKRNQKGWNEGIHIMTALGIGAIVYFVQSMFCLFETITFPIFICLVAILNTQYTHWSVSRQEGSGVNE